MSVSIRLPLVAAIFAFALPVQAQETPAVANPVTSEVNYKDIKTSVQGVVFDQTVIVNTEPTYTVKSIWTIRNESSNSLTFNYRVKTDEDFKQVTLAAGHSLDESRTVEVEDAGLLNAEFEKDNPPTKTEVKRLCRRTVAACEDLADFVGTPELQKKAGKIGENLGELRAAVVHYPLLKLKQIEVAETLAEWLRRKNMTPIEQRKIVKKMRTVVIRATGAFAN